jgi:hypothetical protein
MEGAAVLPKRNLRRVEASEYLRDTYGIPCAPATLAKMVSIGGGPRYHKVNRSPLYPVAELDAWAQHRLGLLRSSSSDSLNVPAHDSTGAGH